MVEWIRFWRVKRKEWREQSNRNIRVKRWQWLNGKTLSAFIYTENIPKAF